MTDMTMVWRGWVRVVFVGGFENSVLGKVFAVSGLNDLLGELVA